MDDDTESLLSDIYDSLSNSEQISKVVYSSILSESQRSNTQGQVSFNRHKLPKNLRSILDPSPVSPQLDSSNHSSPNLPTHPFVSRTPSPKRERYRHDYSIRPDSSRAVNSEDSFVLEQLNSKLSSPSPPRKSKLQESIDLGTLDQQERKGLSIQDLEFKSSFRESANSKVLVGLIYVQL